MIRIAARSSGHIRPSKRVSLVSRTSKSRLSSSTKKTEGSATSGKDLAAPKSAETATKAKEPKSPAAEETTKSTTNSNAENDLPLTNPFPMLAHATENIDLSSRLRAFSNNFAVIGALWCTLSISALSMAPIDDVYKDTQRIEDIDPVQPLSILPAVRWRKVTSRAAAANQQQQQQQKQQKPKRRPPVLVKYFGVPEQYLEDIYMACWSASFFTSAIGLGLSTVVAGIVAATAPAYVKIFVRRHSDILMALPVCQGLSSGFAAVGLSVGLDEARGEPVSWIGYVGTIAGGAIVGSSTLKVLKGYKASRAAGKLSTPPKDV